MLRLFVIFGAFANFRKQTVSLGRCLHVCPSVHMKQLGPTARIFIELRIREFFENYLENSIFIKIWQE
jgi:hypothetical protein